MSTLTLGIVVIIYMFILAWLGYIGYKQTKNASDYLLGGRKVNPVIMALSYGATFISASAIVGFGGVAATFGMGIQWLCLLNMFMGVVIAFIIFGRNTRKLGEKYNARTFPQLLGLHYNSRAIQIFIAAIIFIGMPANMIYNFGSAILRAVGDTKRPLYFLTAAGVINVVLNLFFVIMFQMDVAGVALATAISQAISACLVILCLMESEGGLKLHLKALKIHRSKFRQIIQVGLPAGMQGAVFSISNVLIQSSVNSFGSVAMAGNTTSQNIEGFIYNAMNAVYQANLSFTSQNFGGKKYSRINRIMVTCLGVVTAVGLGMGIPAYLCGHALIRIYSSDPEVIVYGMRRLVVFGTTYFLCGIMDTMVGSIRGLGYSVMPMCVSLLGACGLRIVWIFTVFQVYHNLTVLYLSYPFTWIVTATAHMICFYIVRRKLPKEDA